MIDLFLSARSKCNACRRFAAICASPDRSGEFANGHDRRSAGRGVQGRRHAVHCGASGRRVGRTDGSGAPAPDAFSPDETGSRRRHAGLDLGRPHRQPGHLPVDARPRRRQHGQRRGARVSRSLAADRDHRFLFPPDLRDRPAPAHQPARGLRADREVEHDHRRQDRAPAGAPRHAHRDRRAARPGAFRISAKRDHARGRRLRRRAAADAELDRARPGSRRPQAGARHARQGEAADPDRGLGRLLVRRLGRIRQIRRAARRAGAHHHQMQGHDPGGSPVARRLHHRRADRAQAGAWNPT